MIRPKMFAAFVVGVLLLTACGTRLPDEAFSPTSHVVSSDEAGGGGFGAGEPVTDGDGEVAGAADGSREIAGRGDGDGGPTGPTSSDVGPSGERGAPADAGSGGPAAPSTPQANQASDVGITENTIKIGNITAENGVLGDTFAPAVRGLRAWVRATNAAGGIHGRKIELFTCDDREDRSRSLECARRLVEQDQVFALVSTNSRSLGGAAQYLADKGVPVIGFPISNAFYRYPNFFTIYGAGYPRDGQSVGLDGKLYNSTGQFRWYKAELGVTKAAVFNYDISESSQAGDSFVKGLEAEGFTVTQYTVSFAAPSFDQAVADMQQRGTEIIFDAMDDGANRRLCDAMARRQFEPKAKVSTVVVMGDSLGNNYNSTCRDIVYITNNSRPYTSDHEEVAEFRDAYARYQPGLPLHQWALEGWAQGNIARDAITSMGPAPTRTGFIDFLNEMPANTAEGIMVGTDFRPGSYSYTAPTSKICFSIARHQTNKGGWHMVSDPYPFCDPNAKYVPTEAREQGN